MAVQFQVNQSGVTVKYDSGIILRSSARPPMSFDYDILTYTDEEKTVFHNFSKRDLTPSELTEVSQYIDSIQEDTELTQKMARNAQAAQILHQTDWYVTRSFETGKPIPDHILALRQSARDMIQK